MKYFKQDDDGKFVEVKPSKDYIALIIDGIGSLIAYLKARSSEHSSHIATILGGAFTPQITTSLEQAAIEWVSGNHAGALSKAVPALVILVPTLAAVLVPEKDQASVHALVQTAINSLSTEQIIALLENSAPTITVNAVSQRADNVSST